jgi:hypothetical protein
MLKISDAVRDIVAGDPGLKTGLAQRLMNLTQVARHIHAAVEARTRKQVQITAIAMSLSRLQAELPTLGPGEPLRLAERITVQRGLAVLTFPNTRRCQAGLLPLQERIRRSNGYLTISEGIREITVIVEERAREAVREVVTERAAVLTEVASLSVSLTDANLTTPGVLYRLLQPLALQGVNVAEVTSTTREFHIYIAERDVMLALDSLYGTFGGR